MHWPIAGKGQPSETVGVRCTAQTARARAERLLNTATRALDHFRLLTEESARIIGGRPRAQDVQRPETGAAVDNVLQTC
jgi:hypothetical protein